MNDPEIERLLPILVTNSIQSFQITIIEKLKQIKELFSLKFAGFTKKTKEAFKSNISSIESFFLSNRVDFTQLPEGLKQIRGI